MIGLVKSALGKATRLSLGQNRAAAVENLAAACSVSRATVSRWMSAGLPNKRAANALQRYIDSPEMIIRPAREQGSSGDPGEHMCRFKKPAEELRRADRRRHGKRKNLAKTRAV